MSGDDKDKPPSRQGQPKDGNPPKDGNVGDDRKPPSRQGRRKDGKPFKDGNVREDGSYEIGRNRPPKKGQFAVGDQRPRGRRQKGVPNADTEFMRELQSKRPLREPGRKERWVTKSLGVDLRLIDNAMVKAQNKAIEMVDTRRRRIEEKQQQNRRYHTLGDEQILQAYLKERAQELGIDPHLFGDPPSAEDAGGNAGGDTDADTGGDLGGDGESTDG